MAERHGIETIDMRDLSEKDVTETIRDRTMDWVPTARSKPSEWEAHGNPAPVIAQRAAGLLPDAISSRMIQKVGVDRMSALTSAIAAVRRGGTVSISGVYGGWPTQCQMTMFDKGLTIRMGQVISGSPV